MEVYFKLSVVSPTHIGAGKEKSYKIGLDLFLHKGRYYHVPFDFVVSKLKKGDLEKLSNIEKLTEIVNANISNWQDDLITQGYRSWPKSEFIDPAASRGEVLAHIKDGLGRLYIPGSSIKGSFASRIIHKLFKNEDDLKSGKLGLINAISNSERFTGKYSTGHGKDKVELELMRALAVSDVYLDKDETDILLSKIHNVYGGNLNDLDSLKLGWKNGFSDTSQNDKTTFSTHYETLKVGTKGYCKLSFAEFKGLNFKLHSKHEDLIALFSAGIPKQLGPLYLETIRKDKIFFSKLYQNSQPQHTDEIVKFYSSLEVKCESLINSNKGFIIRLGAGQGYHNITGDWIFDDYLKSIQLTGTGPYSSIKNAGVRDTGNRTKSRKLIRVKGTDKPFSYRPHGFMMFESVEKSDYENFLNSLKK